LAQVLVGGDVLGLEDELADGRIELDAPARLRAALAGVDVAADGVEEGEPALVLHGDAIDLAGERLASESVPVAPADPDGLQHPVADEPQRREPGAAHDVEAVGSVREDVLPLAIEDAGAPVSPLSLRLPPDHGANFLGLRDGQGTNGVAALLHVGPLVARPV